MRPRPPHPPTRWEELREASQLGAPSKTLSLHHHLGRCWAPEGSRTEQALALALLSRWLRNGPSPRGLQGPWAPGEFGVGP